jgi:hypothetical protein
MVAELTGSQFRYVTGELEQKFNEVEHAHKVVVAAKARLENAFQDLMESANKTKVFAEGFKYIIVRSDDREDFRIISIQGTTLKQIRPERMTMQILIQMPESKKIKMCEELFVLHEVRKEVEDLGWFVHGKFYDTLDKAGNAARSAAQERKVNNG